MKITKNSTDKKQPTQLVVTIEQGEIYDAALARTLLQDLKLPQDEIKRFLRVIREWVESKQSLVLWAGDNKDNQEEEDQKPEEPKQAEPEPTEPQSWEGREIRKALRAIQPGDLVGGTVELDGETREIVEGPEGLWTDSEEK